MKRKQLLGSVREALIFPFAYFLSLFWFVPLHAKNAKGKPIVLLHGYLNSAFVWFYMKRKLEKEGFGPIYTINLGFPFASLETFAQNLKNRLEALSSKTGHITWTCVGHSMGGLVAALYSKNYAKTVFFKDIICLGSPFKGTKMNFLGFGRCTKQMAYQYPLLVDLHQWVENQNQITFKSISSGIDHIVVPFESSQVGKEKVFLMDVGHGSMLFSHQTERQLKEWLKAIN
jgi:pimeloyl-ACP methyl ester carboxylesterase